MQSIDSIKRFVLDNGVRVLVEPVGHVASAAIGLWCHTGSRDELEGEGGVTHFIEHMLFKGTPRRNSRQIAEEIEGRGGMLNAFTDKEQTCYYARVLSEDAPIAIDVLSDMLMNSLLDPVELDREKGVVIEEIKQSEDEPSDHVHTVHQQKRWPNHPLGQPVAGTPESVSSFVPESLRAYMRRRYVGSNVVLAATGRVNPDCIVEQARELLGGLPCSTPERLTERPVSVAVNTVLKKPVEQVHFCIGADSVDLYDSDLHTAIVLDAVLGGGMSSRLFQEVREKRGLAYAIGSYCQLYQAGGAFTIYGGTSREAWPQVQEIVRTELKKLASEGAPEDELGRAKRSVQGNLVLALEGMSARMVRMTKNELIYGRDIPVEESLQKIGAVTNQSVIELVQRTLTEDQLSTTAIGAFQSRSRKS